MDNVLRCYSNDIQGTLDDLPEDLDETYERTLRDIDKQNENMPNGCSSAYLCPFAHFALRSLRTFLQSSSTLTAPIFLPKIRGHAI
jgi:hypothetical protein